MPDLRELLAEEARNGAPSSTPPFAGVRRRAQRRRTQHVVAGMAAVVIVAVAATAPVWTQTGGKNRVQPGTGSSPSPSAGLTDAAGQPLPSQLAPQALALSRRNGEANPTQIEAVYVDDASAADRQLGGGFSDSSHNPAYIIEVRGSFTCIDCTDDDSTPAPTGSVVTAIYDAGDLSRLAATASNRWVDLSSLGGAFALPTTDATTGKTTSLAEAKRLAVLYSGDPSHAVVAWTASMTAAQAWRPDGLPHNWFPGSTSVIVVAVNGASPGVLQTAPGSHFAVVFSVTGIGPEPYTCDQNFCGLTAP